MSFGVIGGDENGVQRQQFTHIGIAVLSDQPGAIAINIVSWIELKVNNIHTLRYFASPIFIRMPCDDLSERARRTLRHQIGDLVALRDKTFAQIPNDPFGPAIGKDGYR